MFDKSTLETFQHTKEFLHKYLGSQRGVDVMAAWAMSTWIVDRFGRVKYLCINGKKATGKTSAAIAIAAICWKPIIGTGRSYNGIVHWLNDGCTLILDDYEASKEQVQELDVVLGIGDRKETSTIVKAVVGDEPEEVEFESRSVFGAKLIVTQKSIQDPSIASRMMTITLRKRKDDRPHIWILQEDQDEMAEKLYRWALGFPQAKISHMDFINGLLAGGKNAG